MSPFSVVWCAPQPTGTVGMGSMFLWPQASPSLLSHCPSPAHPIPLPLQTASWGLWLLLSLPLFLLRWSSVCFPRMEAGCPLPRPQVLAGHVLREKGGQGWEENELPRHPISVPGDTPAAGSMTSQPQALVTGETEASCECLSSGRKETNSTPLRETRDEVSMRLHGILLDEQKHACQELG